MIIRTDASHLRFFAYHVGRPVLRLRSELVTEDSRSGGTGRNGHSS
ncbi:hypothetical protein [Algoriphagus winogradskyi]|nr:hypothetical protein [Algoriphagus winogradskyi]